MQYYPYSLYYRDEKLVIILIGFFELHREWISAFTPRNKRVVFMVIVGHAIDNMNYFQERLETLKGTEHVFLCNDINQLIFFRSLNIPAFQCNQNAFLDENVFTLTSVPQQERTYDALLNARLIPQKRPWLANSVTNLALVCEKRAPEPMSESLISNQHIIYRNQEQLTHEQVRDIIHQSKTGLCLSAGEGPCFASSEYLLCGIPVISTGSYGGRSYWYNEYNSIICESTPEAVKMAVEEMIRRAPDPQRIRNEHISLQEKNRNSFIMYTDKLFRTSDITLNAWEYFQKTYKHPLIEWQSLDYIVKSLHE